MSDVYLADTSAWIKAHQRSAPRELRERFDELLLGERIVMCDVVALELLHHEDRPVHFAERRAQLEALPWASVDAAVCARAREVQQMLALSGRGKHRAVGVVDYLIAAAAEIEGASLLHYDADYEQIAAVTAQPHAWLAPRGSI